MNGKGTFYYANGDKYIGHMVNDKKEGEGVYIWTDGSRYEVRCSQMFCYPLL
jgi:hypothetical protein